MSPIYTFVHFRTRKDEYLNELTRDNAQLLINKIWQVHVYVQLSRKLHSAGVNNTLEAKDRYMWF